jgi:glycerophosphoryl diester phosphodiesterase
MRRSIKIALGGAAALGFVYFSNASWLAQPAQGTTAVLAHRGIHQTYSHKVVDRSTCTATIIDPPTNPYLENTISSMRASFAAGADALELDIQPTTDGEFAVFHDWGLECRTNGKGITRQQTMAFLRTLDIGYGYTADGGKTYPFRGKGIGLMPTLAEVFTAFPNRQFLINIKSNDPTEADRLIAYLKAHGLPIDSRLWIFADGRPYNRLAEIAPAARVMSKNGLKSCAIQYVAYGWTGIVPNACRGRFIAIPTNYAPWFWGWPNRLAHRMASADTVIVMMASTKAPDKDVGISHPGDLATIPPHFPAYVMTDDIATIGPELMKMRRSH